MHQSVPTSCANTFLLIGDGLNLLQPAESRHKADVVLFFCNRQSKHYFNSTRISSLEILRGKRFSEAHIKLMETLVGASRMLRNRIFVWDRKFAQRQRLTYRAEDNRLKPEPHQTIIEVFFTELGSRLDPPPYKYTALRDFLEQANLNDLTSQSPSSRYGTPSVLLDDRRDDTGWIGMDGEQHSARDWDGYVSYPPTGSCQFTSLMNPGQLYQRQMASVSDEPLMSRLRLIATEFQRIVEGAERRVMYAFSVQGLVSGGVQGLMSLSVCTPRQTMQY